jgi:hypothetical protein
VVAAYVALPYADVVETLLDLYELRLTAQAQDFVRHEAGTSVAVYDPPRTFIAAVFGSP